MRTPQFVKVHLTQTNQWYIERKEEINARFDKMFSMDPDVSVVIPAYNEEETILRTLSSLSHSITNQRIEVLVVDNNSSDRTAEFVDGIGVKLLFENKQGVKHARNTGLHNARGKIILNADADTLYSPYWIDEMSLPLSQPEVACTYGTFAFFSEKAGARLSYFLYESAGDLFKQVINTKKERAVYVYGMASGYRRTEGLMVGGYEHPEGSNEDGYLALKLQRKFGKLKRIEGRRSLVWTSDRKILLDGGAFHALGKRIKKIAGFGAGNAF